MILQCEKLSLNSNWAKSSYIHERTNMWLCLQSCNRIYECSMSATNSISTTINTKPFVILQFRMPPILEECSTSFVIFSRSIRHRRCLVRQRTSVELPEKKGHNSSTFLFVNNNPPVAATKCICENLHSSGNFILFSLLMFFYWPPYIIYEGCAMIFFSGKN